MYKEMVTVSSVIDLCADIFVPGFYRTGNKDVCIPLKVIVKELKGFKAMAVFDEETDILSFSDKGGVKEMPAYTFLLAGYNLDTTTKGKVTPNPNRRVHMIKGFRTFEDVKKYFYKNKYAHHYSLYVKNDRKYTKVFSRFYSLNSNGSKNYVPFEESTQMEIAGLCQFYSNMYCPIPKELIQQPEVLTEEEKAEIEKLSKEIYYTTGVFDCFKSVKNYLDSELFYKVHSGKLRESKGHFVYEDKEYTYANIFDFEEDKAWVQIEGDGYSSRGCVFSLRNDDVWVVMDSWCEDEKETF